MNSPCSRESQWVYGPFEMLQHLYFEHMRLFHDLDSDQDPDYVDNADNDFDEEDVFDPYEATDFQWE